MNNRSKMLYMRPENRYDEMENRFRDRRGREHYDNGRFAPMRNEYRQSMEGRRRSEYGGNDREDTYRRENYSRYNESGARGDMMRQIGFSAMDGNDDRYNNYGGYGRYGMGDISSGDEMIGGYAEGYGMELTERDITEWMENLENEDGSHGPHYKMEQSEQIRKQRKIECDPVDFNVAMNIMYSDYVKVAQKMNVNNVDFYANMAKAFLDDKDAGVEDKLAAYYYAIVKP